MLYRKKCSKVIYHCLSFYSLFYLLCRIKDGIDQLRGGNKFYDVEGEALNGEVGHL